MLRVLLGVSIAVLGTSACASATNRAADPVTSATPMTATPSVPADSQLRVSAAGWRTNFSRHEVPLGEIISGGPGKDGIPAIDRPSFVAADGASWLADREPVIAIGLGGEWRAYPIQMLVWHEIVNDVIVDVAVAVTFCPLCHTAIALERTVDGRVLDFGTTGNLRHADLVMYDRQTESWWQQATGRAIVGAANAFSRVVDETTLTFAAGDGGTMRDAETGSTWTWDGRAIAGDLTGAQLEPLVADSPFWFAWAVFRPDTRIWHP